MHGRSSVRQLSVASGEILLQTKMDAKNFGEGLTLLGDTVYQIIWQSGQGFMYNPEDLSLVIDWPCRDGFVLHVGFQTRGNTPPLSYTARHIQDRAERWLGPHQ